MEIESFVNDLKNYEKSLSTYYSTLTSSAKITPLEGEEARKAWDAIRNTIKWTSEILEENRKSGERAPFSGIPDTIQGVSASQIKDMGWEITDGEVVLSQLADVYVSAPLNTEFGDMTTELIKTAEEQGMSRKITDYSCGACKKYFTAKRSLNRHYERKPACKEWLEKNSPETEFLDHENLPPLRQWVDSILENAISGGSEKPYCKHCDIEFANTGNLHKHISKSVVCNKMAYKEFFVAIRSKIVEEEAPGAQEKKEAKEEKKIPFFNGSSNAYLISNVVERGLNLLR